MKRLYSWEVFIGGRPAFKCEMKAGRTAVQRVRRRQVANHRTLGPVTMTIIKRGAMR